MMLLKFRILLFILLFFNSDNVAYDKIVYDFILVRVRII
jgi:hypothetical protein